MRAIDEVITPNFMNSLQVAVTLSASHANSSEINLPKVRHPLGEDVCPRTLQGPRLFDRFIPWNANFEPSGCRMAFKKAVDDVTPSSLQICHRDAAKSTKSFQLRSYDTGTWHNNIACEPVKGFSQTESEDYCVD